VENRKLEHNIHLTDFLLSSDTRRNTVLSGKLMNKYYTTVYNPFAYSFLVEVSTFSDELCVGATPNDPRR
jgi:hypothetical protein